MNLPSSYNKISWLPIVLSKKKKSNKADCLKLERSSISFFQQDKHETAISRWSRATTRAAKIGKGLSNNSKAQTLFLPHWLEAIDPQHRYGHNLNFYYQIWLRSPSKQPFFYWLDIGEGKEINIVEKCPRSKLQQQCVKYLDPLERMSYEVVINDDGKLVYKHSNVLVNTSKDSKWIFVLSTSMVLYIGKKKKGSFQHSSFLSGAATSAAGRIIVDNGLLKAVWPYIGHYRPTPENFQDFIAFLKGNRVDLTDVKLEPMLVAAGKETVKNRVIEEELSSNKRSSTGAGRYCLEQPNLSSYSSGASVRSRSRSYEKISLGPCGFAFTCPLHKFSSRMMLVDK